MAVLKCAFCGERLYYHGEPEGKYPVEHYFCKSDKWKEFEKENLPADSIEIEHEYPLIKSWKCWRCGTFSFFSDYTQVPEIYVPQENFLIEPMQEPIEFGPFWNDFQWFDITESDVKASEVLAKFPDNHWLAKNETELRIYEDESHTKCIGQYKRFQIPENVTIATMSLESFKKMLVEYDDEIDFFYHKMSYEVIKEKLVGKKIKITINRDFDNPQCKYSIEVYEDENFVDELVNARIFDDGKSIVQAQNEVEL